MRVFYFGLALNLGLKKLGVSSQLAQGPIGIEFCYNRSQAF